jgi:hypothetical protein
MSVIVVPSDVGGDRSRPRRGRRAVVERRRRWWREAFAESASWEAARAAFMPPVEPGLLPASLLDRFAGDGETRLLGFLRFLGPIAGGAGTAQAR